MLRQQINLSITQALNYLVQQGFFNFENIAAIQKKNLVTPCKEKTFGDYSTSVAMQLAPLAKKKPLEIAAAIQKTLADLPESKNYFSKIEIAAPGFINFSLAPEYIKSQACLILKEAGDYGKINVGQNEPTNVEFVSANPSSMMHVGNGRSAFFGDVLANVLRSAGYKVEKEYYINDARASKQINELGKTALGLGESYKSEYLNNKIANLGPRLSQIKSETEAGYFLANEVLKDLKEFITNKLGIEFDCWVSEESLYRQSLVTKTYDWLKEKGLVVEREGAFWLDMSQFNQKDEVLMRSNGTPTYFLSDIAYHKSKIDRGYKKIIDIWGADHQGHVPRMKAVMKLLGFNGDFEILLCQMVNINGARLSKRAGNIIPLDWLINEVGTDAARFFYLQNSLQSQMDFNVELAKEKSSNSPVFYVQYAYARISSILRKADIENVATKPGLFDLLKHPSELDLIKELLRMPEIVEDTAADYQLQRLCQYALSLATAFHRFYHDCQVISDNKDLTQSRLALICAAKIVLRNTLIILGISAPEKM